MEVKLPIRPLTARELTIADLLLEGCENEDIAKQTGLKRRTVKAHMQNMFRKYNIKTGIKRVKLAVFLYRERNLRESSTAKISPERDVPDEVVK